MCRISPATHLSLLALLSIVFAAPATICAQTSAQTTKTLTGQAAFTNYSQERPGIRRKLTLADLPEPHPDESVDNGPTLVPRPDGAWPLAPAGFKVELYAQGFQQPRLIRTAPNGDLFVADSAAGKIMVLRGRTADGHAATTSTFASGLDHPFGIAFYPLGAQPHWVYIANTTSVVRFAYKSGDLVATAKPETIVPVLPGYAQLRGGGHWTRDVAFSLDGKRMWISVGSGSNADDADTHPNEFHRADILEYTPEGNFVKVYASGLRNCVGETVNPITGQLWCSTNERDALGNNLVPDYITSVPENGFFGWPWYYMGGHQDPRLPKPCANGTGPNPQLTAPLTAAQAIDCARVDLSAKVLTPDVILQPHFASLELLFYAQHPGPAGFPAPYRGDGFAAEHGSWNRKDRAGYEVIRIPMHAGRATGEFEDFLTGFTTPDGKVWGRPVGVAVGRDGSLFVSDDASKTVWHVSYSGK
jgi:glucose/arabinose dehydrogenase